MCLFELWKSQAWLLSQGVQEVPEQHLLPTHVSLADFFRSETFSFFSDYLILARQP
jgi:hypothetical protein